ncbi:putative sporulation-specific N-formyltyrosine oxidase Dit2 [Cadophora sp. DSE1049]|nr:putative sporulation-specific N-formyltyrosine oxidase Dit2 [Cadophora sp. DSE1049]
MFLLVLAISGGFIIAALHAHAAFARRNDGIPTIPLYTNIISLLRGETRNDFYERNLKSHLQGSGVVRTWLAGHWSLLITQPELLVEIFKNEQIYSKAGFNIKTPGTVFGHLFGANIGDSHGHEWKLFRTYMKPGLQDKPADYQALCDISNRFIDVLLSEHNALTHGGPLTCDETARKWAIDVVGSHFFNNDFQALTNAKANIVKLWKSVLESGHTPFRSTFPTTESFDWMFPSRCNAHQAVRDFHNYLAEVSEHQVTESDTQLDVPKQRCVSEGLIIGYLDGKLSKRQLCCNLTATFINGHENILALTKSAMWVLGRRPELQAALRKEALDTNARTKAELHSMPLLASVVFETGRLYPPLSQLANRLTLEATLLGGRYPIAKGQWVGWNSYGVHTSTSVWGPDALEFKPERWGSDVEAIDKMFRRCQNSCTYITWNAHARKCMGISFALLQCKMVLCEMVKRVLWTVDPSYKYTMKHGSVLSPQNVPMIFTEITKGGF